VTQLHATGFTLRPVQATALHTLGTDP
jgi:hypothetical protein